MGQNSSISNFGRNVLIEPDKVFQPESADEVLAILRQHPGTKVRVMASLHAWSEGAKTSGIAINLRHLDTVTINADAQTVTVGAGCKVKRLLNELAKHGLTLPSIGLIDEQTIAGATATATHGSGKNSLSHYIQSVQIAHIDSQSGEPTLTEVDTGPLLQAARCSLGLLGIIVSIRLRCRPGYRIQEHAAAYDSLESVVSKEADYPQQQFYLIPWSWTIFAHHRVETNTNRSLTATLYRWYCLLAVDIGLHLMILALGRILRLAWPVRFFFKRIVPLTIIRNCKVVDDAHAMLVMEHELFRHIEIEVFVQRNQLASATEFLIDTLSWLGGQPMPNKINTDCKLHACGRTEQFEAMRGRYVHHYPICFRRVQSDDVLISMAAPSEQSHEDWYAISLISYHRPNDRKGFFQLADFIAPAFAELFGGRTHWGKYNPLDKPTNEKLYPRLDEFRSAMATFDPTGVFRNDWLDRVVGLEPAATELSET